MVASFFAIFSIPPNSIQPYTAMERYFHDIFYWPRSKVMTSDMMKLKQHLDVHKQIKSVNAHSSFLTLNMC